MNIGKKTKEALLQELHELRKENESLKLALTKNSNESKLIEIDIKSLTGPANNPLIPDDLKNIRQLFDDYIKMYASRDDQLTTHFSDNFSGFTGGGDFLVKDVAEWIAITRQDFAQVKDPIRIELKDTAIQLLSDTIAVTTGFFTIHLPIKDHILSRETARLVLIFRKEDTGWKITHSSISIPYYLVREGEVYPMKELVDRNQFLEEQVAERTTQLSNANSNLQQINKELEKEIIEHKLAEEALKLTNQKLEAIISASPDGIGMISLDGKMQLISDKLAEMYGYSVEQIKELIGVSALDFVDSSNHNLLNENIRKLITGTSDHNISEYLAIKKDNTRFNVELNSTILLDSNGNPASILYVERDITKRKLAEKALQQSKKRLEAIISATPDGIGIISLDGKLLFLSDKLVEMYDYSIEDKDELIGRQSLDFIDPSNHELLVENIYKLVTGTGDNKIKEYLAVKNDGSRFYVEINYNVLFNSSGEPESILFVERDSTARKQTEAEINYKNEQLIIANAQKDKFFSIIAHDLRSPFQGLLGLTEVMATGIHEFSTDEVTSFSISVHKSVVNLYKLLENLLEWAMLQKGSIDFTPKELYLSEVFSHSVALIKQGAIQKEIKIISEIPETLKIFGDDKMINSVLRNLLSNAIKFTRRGGEIIVLAKEIEDGKVEVSVTDTGIGIPKELIGKLFTLGEKVGTTGTENEPSTGLGLLLCKELVEKHGGTIWVESKEGIGSTFSFSLPKM